MTDSLRMRCITSFSKSSLETAIAVTVSPEFELRLGMWEVVIAPSRRLHRNQNLRYTPIPAAATAPGAVRAPAPGELVLRISGWAGNRNRS
jgi:hypothetical protein